MNKLTIVFIALWLHKASDGLNGAYNILSLPQETFVSRYCHLYCLQICMSLLPCSCLLPIKKGVFPIHYYVNNLPALQSLLHYSVKTLVGQFKCISVFHTNILYNISVKDKNNCFLFVVGNEVLINGAIPWGLQSWYVWNWTRFGAICKRKALCETYSLLLFFELLYNDSLTQADNIRFTVTFQWPNYFLYKKVLLDFFNYSSKAFCKYFAFNTISIDGQKSQ